MRLLIVAPRKTGNAQLRCLLASAYGLELVNSRDAPGDGDFHQIASWLENLPHNSVAHTSFRYTTKLETLASSLGITLIAVLRHPFDLFVSIHEIAQHRSDKKGRQLEEGDPWALLKGKELEDPSVLAYLQEEFSQEIDWLKGWHESGVPILRYELLEAEPSRALRTLSVKLGHLAEDAIARAIALCPAENLVRSSPIRGKRMPPVPSGAWRERLPDIDIAVLRDRYGDDVKKLGYDLP